MLDFQAAHAAAATLGLRLPELRAGTRLTRMGAGEDRLATLAALRVTYGAFTEGFDSRDLVEARALLDA